MNTFICLSIEILGIKSTDAPWDGPGNSFYPYNLDSLFFYRMDHVNNNNK
jgi:hypothetical protein